MRNNILFLIFYIIFALNSNLLSEENNKKLKVGLLAPLSGPYSEIGNSLLYSLQLALEEINDENVIIVPRDSGFNNKEKLSIAINDLRSLEVKVIIGPTTHKEFENVKRYNDLIRSQTHELFSNYGKIDVLFIDGSPKEVCKEDINFPVVAE